VVGGKALVLACETRSLPIVVAGTCEEYGDQQAPFHEDLPTRPVSPYSTAKAELNAWILNRIQAEGLGATIVRPFLTYGPGQISPRLIPTAIQAALKGDGFDATTGLQTREFNFVTDMALALMAAADPAVAGQILNLGGGEERSLREVVEEIYRLAGADSKRVNWGSIPHRTGEATRFFGEHSRFERQLKHRPKMNLTDGLRATITWWRSR
jgi:nucleoside-diphosphate-sugar epimerase